MFHDILNSIGFPGGEHCPTPTINNLEIKSLKFQNLVIESLEVKITHIQCICKISKVIYNIIYFESLSEINLLVNTKYKVLPTFKTFTEYYFVSDKRKQYYILNTVKYHLNLMAYHNFLI